MTFYDCALPTRCGICGDAWNASPAEHEAPGGSFANGILVASYTPGQDIDVTVLVTANHKVSHGHNFCVFKASSAGILHVPTVPEQ